MRIKISAILFLLLSLFSEGQQVDSLVYYDRFFSQQDSIINSMCKEARHNRHGLLVICVDSDLKPIVGESVHLNAFVPDSGKDDVKDVVVIATGITDIYGVCVFLPRHYSTIFSSAGGMMMRSELWDMSNSAYYGYVDDTDVTKDDNLVLHRISVKQMQMRKRWNMIISGDDNLGDMSDRVRQRTLTDEKSKTKYILDISQIYITAIDSTGKQLWKTDPWKDNNLGRYGYDRPIIIGFNIQQNGTGLSIEYNSTQFGVIDKKTGKFIFHGQD